jgi:hypothetical protein
LSIGVIVTESRVTADVDRLADLDDLSQPPAAEPDDRHHVIALWSKET